ncbi:hypothetical protein CPAV1605_1120 [seawater metagenome]|uniref:Uncharacterized protein n=1 Tax=seawater metagenome TaxID=1561972 RepID=A0A5E8CKV5_9ZZZZ
MAQRRFGLPQRQDARERQPAVIYDREGAYQPPPVEQAIGQDRQPAPIRQAVGQVRQPVGQVRQPAPIRQAVGQVRQAVGQVRQAVGQVRQAAPIRQAVGQDIQPQMHMQIEHNQNPQLIGLQAQLNQAISAGNFQEIGRITNEIEAIRGAVGAPVDQRAEQERIRHEAQQERDRREADQRAQQERDRRAAEQRAQQERRAAEQRAQQERRAAEQRAQQERVRQAAEERVRQVAAQRAQQEREQGAQPNQAQIGALQAQLNAAISAGNFQEIGRITTAIEALQREDGGEQQRRAEQEELEEIAERARQRREELDRQERQRQERQRQERQAAQQRQERQAAQQRLEQQAAQQRLEQQAAQQRLEQQTEQQRLERIRQEQQVEQDRLRQLEEDRRQERDRVRQEGQQRAREARAVDGDLARRLFDEREEDPRGNPLTERTRAEIAQSIRLYEEFLQSARGRREDDVAEYYTQQIETLRRSLREGQMAQCARPDERISETQQQEIRMLRADIPRQRGIIEQLTRELEAEEGIQRTLRASMESIERTEAGGLSEASRRLFNRVRILEAQKARAKIDNNFSAQRQIQREIDSIWEAAETEEERGERERLIRQRDAGLTAQRDGDAARRTRERDARR